MKRIKSTNLNVDAELKVKELTIDLLRELVEVNFNEDEQFKHAWIEVQNSKANLLEENIVDLTPSELMFLYQLNSVFVDEGIKAQQMAEMADEGNKQEEDKNNEDASAE